MIEDSALLLKGLVAPPMVADCDYLAPRADSSAGRAT